MCPIPPPSPDWLSWAFWTKDSQGLYHLALIAAGTIGIPLLAVRTFAANRSAKAADAQARTAEQGHITDRFTKAVEQLSSDKMTVRLGAIYALERISRDSRRDYWTIMETLTAYVREHAPWPPRQAFPNPFVQLQVSDKDGTGDGGTPAEAPETETEQTSAQVCPATDIDAILTVLRRRDEQACKQDKVARRCLDLASTDLRGAGFAQAHLENAILISAHLEGAHLRKAHLEGAGLAAAHFEDADLEGAHLEGAILWEADLKGATHLTQKQVDGAYGDEKTTLPPSLTRPAHWSAVKWYERRTSRRGLPR